MIFVDIENKCHATNPEGKYREFDVPFFYGKCPVFIEGFKYYPPGETYMLPDGTVSDCEMITVWKPYSELDSAQREYERQLLAEYEAALAESVPLSDLTAAYHEGVNAAYDQE